MSADPTLPDVIVDKKYRFFIEDGDYRISVHRYGEPWLMIESGHNAILALMQEVRELRRMQAEAAASLTFRVHFSLSTVLGFAVFSVVVWRIGFYQATGALLLCTGIFYATELLSLGLQHVIRLLWWGKKGRHEPEA